MRALAWRRSRYSVNDGLSDGGHARPRRGSGDSFFPARLREPLCLQEGIGHHCHENVAMQPHPGSPFEMVEAEFLLELLMRLFANPAPLNGAGDVFDRYVGEKVGEIVFPLAV